METLNKQKNIEWHIRDAWNTKLIDYVYIDPNNYKVTIEPGKILSYISLDLNKISFGVITKITFNKSGTIKYIILKSPKYNSCWRIDIKQHHIFLYQSSNDNDITLYAKNNNIV